MLLTESLLGSSSVAANYIEDVFSTYLYTGTGATQTITNGIDLSGKGGLVWMKNRTTYTQDHALYDTARGATFDLASNTTGAQSTQSTGLTSFNSNGFSIGALTKINTNGVAYTSWTFRKQAKFFDVVTYTGNGTNGRSVPHSLGSVPGMIIVKRTDTTGAWCVYHRSAGGDLFLNTTAAQTGTLTNITFATSTTFDVGVSSGSNANANGGTYVAYLFAHNAGGFGASGSDNVISCGSWTGTGSAQQITLGWEPQFIIAKNISAPDNWFVIDTMRAWPATTSTASQLYTNSSGAEVTGANKGPPNATGFTTAGFGESAGQVMIYVAIRRGPMKTPTSGTSVFAPVTRTGTGANASITTNFPVDFGISRARTAAYSGYGAFDRLRGNVFSYTPVTDAEYSGVDYNVGLAYDSNTAMKVGADSNQLFINGVDTSQYSSLFFRRAPGFFDVVCYTGTGANTTQAHNLGVVPELMIVKRRSAGFTSWQVYSGALANTEYLVLNTTAAKATGATRWNSTTPTASVFSLGGNVEVNASAVTYVAYLFATVAGVSKVGSYTGTGTTKQIDCGFTGGARFVLIKRTDSTGDWYVWDSARGIVAGNDPYLLLNSTAAEVTSTDYIDTYSAGFEISSTAPAAINASGGTFIFLAIA